MNQWAFVIAAYAVALAGTAALLIGSLASMRRSEAEAERLRSDGR
ncbi:MAG TPA: hypothetical protein VFP53_08375 [Sphingomicrobium sp.]|nr:hypothetical protein [Sphingomicrobium sp.]